MSKQLFKVLEHIINGNEEGAKDVLHQLFIEKARAIHEELISMDDDTIPGDEGEDLERQIRRNSNRIDQLDDAIDAEETMTEDEDEDAISLDDAEDDISDDMTDGDDVDDELGDEDLDADEDHDMSLEDLEDSMHDLEDALEELKAEFKALESGEDAEEGEEDVDADMEDEDLEDIDDEVEGDETADEDGDENWDDLEESIDLDVITSNFYGPSSKAADEVGSGKFATPDTVRKSPVPASQKDRFGAEPTDFDKGPVENGYVWKSGAGYVPKNTSSTLSGMTDNRRKKAMDGMSAQSSGYGKDKDQGAKLQHDGDFPSDTKAAKSPLTRAPKK